MSREYLINNAGWFDEGGYCQFYPILGRRKIGFKEFLNKSRAQYALSVQKKLSKYDLAPKTYSGICKLKFAAEQDHWVPEVSEWGFVTELVKTTKNKKLMRMNKIQQLVDDIYAKTGLKFWDCHYDNIGLIKRGSSFKLVCIDTGRESFTGDSNYWGDVSPGPRCSYCCKYKCKCEGD